MKNRSKVQAGHSRPLACLIFTKGVIHHEKQKGLKCYNKVVTKVANKIY